MMKELINILHLSDIHFGMEEDKTQLAQRKNALDELLVTISNLDYNEKPHIIVISGDITWQGKIDGFSSAKSWLQQLLNKVSLNPNNIILCPGNHDLDRKKTIGLGVPISSAEADDWLSVENMGNFYGPFKNYIEFCEDLGVIPLKLSDQDNYLVGTRDLEGINFVVLNSAWFCRSREDARKLWVGLPQLELMNAENQIVHFKEGKKPLVTIAILHHPLSWLHEEEQSSYNDRPSTYRYLSERVDLILSGHTHGAYEPATRIFNHAYFISGGAAYSGGRFRNNFSIIKVNTKESTVERIPFEYDPRTNSWGRIKNEKLFLNLQNERGEEQLNKHLSYESLKDKGATCIWNIPHQRHPFFIGRNKEIAKLKELLHENDSTQKLFAIHGMGGVGKSQLAVEYAYTYENLYKIIWWIRADDTITIMADIEDLCIRLGLSIRNQNGESIALEELFGWMEQNEDWLLIFDNAGSQTELADFIPIRHRGKILITSRNPNWIVSIPLKLLETEQSIEFIINSTGQNDLETARLLSRELGDLPLALEQASAYIRESGLSMMEYLERFRNYRSYIISKGNPLNYSSTVATAWEISIQKVCEDIPISNDFMIFCSFLFPELIIKDIFYAESVLPQFLKNSITSLMEFDDLLTKLRSFSLIQTGSNGFTIHRLIQFIINDKLSSEEKKEWTNQIVNHLVLLLDRSKEFEIKISDIIPHIINVCPYIFEDENITKEKIALLEVLFKYYLDFGLLSKAKELAYLILDFSNKIPADYQVEILFETYRNLGLVHVQLGQFADAKKHLQYAISNITLNPNKRAILLNSLVHVERELGNFYESLSLYLELNSLIEEHPNDFDSYDRGEIANSLGMILSNMSDYERAEECFKKAISYWTEEEKKPYHLIAFAASNLGNIYRLKGKNEESRKFYKKAIDLNIKIYGEEHASVSVDYGNIGLSYYNEYNFFYAKRYFRKAIEINKVVFDEINAHNAILLNNIGMVEEAAENYVAAKKCYEDSLKMFQNLGNDENHDFANTYYNLGGVHHLLKDYRSAEHYLNRALEIDRKVYGNDHPEVAKDLGKIGTLMIDQKKVPEAIKYLKESREIYEAKNLIQSPDYVMSIAYLAIALYMQGRIKLCRSLLDKSLNISQDILGKNNSQQRIILASFLRIVEDVDDIEIVLDYVNLLIKKYGITEG